MARKDLKKDAKPKPKLKPKAKAKESFKAHRDGLVPVVYQDMLAEAESSLPSNLGDDGRTIKKRRVGGRLIGSVKVEPERPQDLEGDVEAQISIDRDETASPRPPQTIDVESEDMTDSDAAWEEVNLKDISEMESLDGDEDEKDSLIDLVLDSKLGSAHKHIVRRKPMSTEIRKTRLAIHKLHLLCLLSHVYLRNHWCNDEQVQYTIPNDVDLPMDKSDFRELATQRQGSRDVGAQLFCAMLRSAGLDTRLVCSLQPLPFTATSAGSTSQGVQRSYVMAEEENQPSTSDSEETPDPRRKFSVPSFNSATSDSAAFRIRSKLAARLGRPPQSGTAPAPPPPAEPKKDSLRPIRESSFPVYWVEAFNTAIQKWVSVDPLTTRTIAQPSKLYPPANDSSNRLSYVIAFEEDYAVRDVTLRYSPAFNAKTRRLRVEDSKGGKRWWERTLRFYRPRYELDRDQLEDAELKAKEAREPMPRSVADFKGHPHFALERHLKRGEAIHPKRKVGKVNIGKSVETVYRKRDVHVVKSADNWYRLGREIKPGEQSLKRVRSRKQAEAQSDDITSEGDRAGTALYAPFQTQAYVAPPVVNGRVPKNAFGNIDVYVLSMIPPGASYIPHPETSRAARVLGIDYSDAVTGFEFKGRHGMAIVKGAVVADSYQEAVITVIQGFDDDRRQEEEEKRTLEALRMWKRIMTGLKIRQRIDGYEIEGQRSEQNSSSRDNIDEFDDARNDSEISYNNEDDEMAGGFMPTSDTGPVAEPTISRHLENRAGEKFPRQLRLDGLLDRDAKDYQPTKRKSEVLSKEIVNQLAQVESHGGGFMVDENNGMQGGYVRTNIRPSPQSEVLHTQMSDDPIQLAGLGDEFRSDPNDNSDCGDGSHSDENMDLSSPSSNSSKPSHLLNREELEEATLLQQLHEMGQENLNTRNAEPLIPGLDAFSPKNRSIATQETLENNLNGSVQSGMKSPHSSNSRQKAQDDLRLPTLLKRRRSSSMESKGSLLSYDPEDDDVEPDWLD